MSIYEDRLRGLAASAVTAAPKPWDPQLHPRARDGKFIKVGGWVRGLFRIGNGDYEKLNGRVLGVEKNPRYPKDPLVRVATKHGDITAPVSQISAALEPKGTLAKIVSVLPGVHIAEDPPEIVAYKAAPLDGDKTFLSGVPLEGAVLNGIPLTEVDFDPSSIPDVDVGEPPLPEPVMPSWVKDPEKWKPTKMRQSAGVMIEEPDGRVWLYEPQNRFGGYNFTFSKGGVEDGDTMQQAAMREAFEELGLVTEITGYIGDYKGSTTMTRLYRGKRVGGAPWKHDNEVAEVRLVASETASSLLNMLRDQQILADFTGDDTYLEAFKERAAQKAAERAAKKAAEDAARAAARAKNVASVDRNFDGETRAQIQDVVDELAERFPRAPLKSVRLNKKLISERHQFAGKDGENIYIDGSGATADGWEERFKEWDSVLVDASPAGTVLHEFGHLLDGMALKGNKAEYQKLWDYVTQEEPFLDGVYPRWQRSPELPSAYAGDSKYEFIAEAFAEYMTREPEDMKPASLWIGEFFERMFGPRAEPEKPSQTSKEAAISLTEKYMKAGKKPASSPQIEFRTGSDYQGSAQQGQTDGWVQADVDGTAAATLDYSIVSDEPDTLYIDMIEVLPKYQGRGLGKKLLDKVIADQWTQWGEDPPTIEPGLLTDAGMQWWQTVEADPKYKTEPGSSLSEALSE